MATVFEQSAPINYQDVRDGGHALFVMRTGSGYYFGAEDARMDIAGAIDAFGNIRLAHAEDLAEEAALSERAMQAVLDAVTPWEAQSSAAGE